MENFNSIWEMLDEPNKKSTENKGTNLYPNCDENVWLRSCEHEIFEPLEGEIKGVIPIWLKGQLLRNGPGSLKVGNMTFNHLFDSSALLHRFGIQNGKVTYQCRFLETNSLKRNQIAQRIVVTEFGTKPVPDPCHSIFHRVSSMFKPGEANSDNAMISIYPFNDEYFTFTESPVIFNIDIHTLATKKRINLSEKLGIVNHTSHPHIDKDGTVYNLGTIVTKTGPNYVIICFPKGENIFDNAHIVANLPARFKLNPSYMHTFGLTENYYIIVEQPLTVSVSKVFKSHLLNDPLISCMKWFPENQTYIHVLNRQDTNKIFTFKAESFFYLHIINAYEEQGHIVLDICCYKDPSMINCMYIETMKNMQQDTEYAKLFRGRPLRFVLPLIQSNLQHSFSLIKLTRSISESSGISMLANIFKQSQSTFFEPNDNVINNTQGFNRNKRPKTVDKEIEALLATNLITLNQTHCKAMKLSDGNIFCKPEILCNLGCETPRINYEKYLGVKYRFFYAISSDVDAENPGTLIKVDTYTKTCRTWCEVNCYPSEPIFVPSPDSNTEDDGIVLASMVWGGNNSSNKVGLLILCAKTFKEIGRAEFLTPGPVPKCLHGWFAKQK